MRLLEQDLELARDKLGDCQRENRRVQAEA